MKTYTKNGNIKQANSIVVRITKEVNGKQKTFQVINPSEEMILADGWIEYTPPIPTAEELEELKVKAEINAAKLDLQEGDYKIIKCMEAYLCGEELPYDINALHHERNEYREKIRKYDQV